MKNAPTTASAGAARATPVQRSAGRLAAANRGPSRRSPESLLQDNPLVAFDDFLEVRRQRKRAAILGQILRRDIGEQLVPRRLIELGLHVLRINARIPVELLDDAV